MGVNAPSVGTPTPVTVQTQVTQAGPFQKTHAFACSCAQTLSSLLLDYMCCVYMKDTVL